MSRGLDIDSGSLLRQHCPMGTIRSTSTRQAKDKANAYIRMWWRREMKRLRIACVEKYGGKCIQCGYSDLRALQFDHVKSDGASDKGVRMKPSYYRRILNDASGRWQLLCANCNRIKLHTHCERNKGQRNKSW